MHPSFAEYISRLFNIKAACLVNHTAFESNDGCENAS